MNIGVLEAGTAPNVTPEHARAEVLFRSGLPVEQLLARIRAFTTGGVELSVPYRSDPILFRLPKGVRGEIVSFASDLPLLTAWGEPLLAGPGSIHDAHAAEEKVDLAEVRDAVSLYTDLVRGLLSRGDAYLEPKSSDPLLNGRLEM